MTFSSDGERSRYEAVLAKLNASSRLDLCKKILLKDGLNLIEALKEKNSVDFVGFCPEIAALPSDAARLDKALAGTRPDRGR